MARLLTPFKEGINCFNLISWKWSLSCYAILRAGHDINIVPYAAMCRKPAGILSEKTSANSRASARAGLFEAASSSHDCAARRSSRAYLGFIPSARLWLPRAGSRTTRHSCSTPPLFKLRSKSSQQSSGSCVIVDAVEGGINLDRVAGGANAFPIDNLDSLDRRG